MTHIARLELSHFRSHCRSVIGAGPRPVAISGPNGAGKTNVLEAISLLSPGRGLRRATTDDMARRPELLGWRVAAELDSGGRVHEIDTRAEPGQSRQLRIDGKAGPQAALGRIARILWLVPAMDRLWIEGAEERRRFLDRITLSFEPGHADVSLAYEKAMRERNRLLRDDVRDSQWYGALEAQMAEAGAKIRVNRESALERISGAQEGAETAFPAASLALSEPEPASDLRAALSAGRTADLRAGRTLAGPHRADLAAIYRDKGVPAEQCSTGEQKALLISLILANARALSAETGMAPILLLDEVAAHLDPNRRSALYDEICALGCQAWLTGTEPGLFDGLSGRALHLAVTESDGGSVVSELGGA